MQSDLKTDWQPLMVGMFIGYLLTLGWSWYVDRDKMPDDWCNGLPTAEEATHCHDLYQKHVDYLKWMEENYGERPESRESRY